MNEEKTGLLADILANPSDDTPRLVYADWLTDHGSEIERIHAEFIREQCAWHSQRQVGDEESFAGTPGFCSPMLTPSDACHGCAARRLFAGYGHQLGEVVATLADLNPRGPDSAAPDVGANPFSIGIVEWTWVRGFPHRLIVHDTEVWVEIASRVTRAWPVQEVYLEHRPYDNERDRLRIVWPAITFTFPDSQ